MKILLVDDEPAILSELQALLAQRTDLEIFSANSAAAARTQVEATGAIDLLVSDVVMPDEDGLSLRESLLVSLPNLRTIFLSEYDLSDYADRMSGCPLVAKPVDGKLLQNLVDQLFPQVAAVAAAPTPVAKPAAVAATPAPVAKPAAVAATPAPVAKPAAVAATPAPVAKPAAVAATPTPAAKPAAVAASPTPAAKPAAVAASPTPAAKPAAVAATPTPAAKPAAVAATPTPAAKPAAVAASPTPAAKPAAAAKPASAAPPVPETELPADEFVGQTLGAYVIEAKVGQTDQGGIYRATQTSMSRSVRLYLLSRELSANPDAVKSFVADASIKANVKQASILTVYEAGQSDGIYFYSCEYFRASTLGQIIEKSVSISEQTAFHVLKTVASGLADLAQNNIRCHPLTLNAILIAGGDKIRLSNIAAHTPASISTPAEDMKTLSAGLLQALPPTSDGSIPGLRELLARMQAGDPALLKWAPLLSAVNAITPKVQVSDAYKLDARERAAIKALEESKKKQKRSLLINGLVSLSLLTVALAVVYWAVFIRGTSYRNFDTMIQIPAGEFIYQEGEQTSLPEFWIDEHPVTIGQYSEFLKWIEENPDKLQTVVHPEAPSGKTYIPEGWADQKLNTGPMPGYFTRAKRWGKYKGAPLDLDSPVFGVDFFDAWSYAKWKGRRLPTEKEWEKAARGTTGNLFPWGNEPDNKRVNSGADFDPNPEKGGNIDGWKRWSTVDAIKGDKSPFGVMGMAGNVSEWTDSWTESPELGGLKVPVIRGGNWQNPDYRLTRRLTVRMAEQNDMVLGFRTASDTPPTKAP